MISYINGEFVNEDEAKISVFDQGFMLGDGVYEIERTFNGAPFRLDDHLAHIPSRERRSRGREGALMARPKARGS